MIPGISAKLTASAEEQREKDDFEGSTLSDRQRDHLTHQVAASASHRRAGNDGKTRVVTVRTAAAKLKRQIHKLMLLPSGRSMYVHPRKARRKLVPFFIIVTRRVFFLIFFA